MRSDQPNQNVSGSVSPHKGRWSPRLTAEWTAWRTAIRKAKISWRRDLTHQARLARAIRRHLGRKR